MARGRLPGLLISCKSTVLYYPLRPPLPGGAQLLQGQEPAGGLSSGGDFSRPSPCVPNDERRTGHFYRSKEQIVRRCSHEMKDWKDETGQENGGSFYDAGDDVRP